MALSARGHILLIVFFTVAAALCFGTGIAPVGFVTIGMLVGTISRDPGQLLKVTRVWSIVSRVIDWQALNSLLFDIEPKAGTGSR